MIPSSTLFSFRVVGIPVEIGTTAALLVGFLALSYGRSGTAGLVTGLAYAVVLLASILVHELGHAIIGTRLGLQPQRIVLHGFGGFTQYGRRPQPRAGVISSLAGPGAGLLLGVALIGLRLALPLLLPSVAHGPVIGLLGMAIAVNIFWSLFNLLPIYPLDGGQVLWHGLRIKLAPDRANRIVRNVSIPVAILTGVVGYLLGYIFIPLICFFAVMQVLRL
ncbi:MAG: hypothetical protein GXP62_10500 [Oligoflexia bacterium]|nr:hypothetical protein [Oligoflexia bacterium]